MESKKEIQWVTIQKTDELELIFQQMIQFMMATKQTIVTFFLDYEEDGYMLEAYDDYDFFEATARTREIG